MNPDLAILALAEVKKHPDRYRGVQGDEGPQGPKGDTGEQGPKGDTGAAGTDGKDGRDGLNGLPGLVWRGPWAEGTPYRPRDVVEQAGSSWVALTQTRTRPPGKAWDLVAKKGTDGRDGRHGLNGGGGSGGTVSLSDATPLVELGAGAPGASSLASRGDHVHPAGGGDGVTDHGALTGLADDDHPQYTTDAEAGVIADASVATHAGLANPHPTYLTQAEGDALYPAIASTVLDGDAAGGDLSGTYPNPSVTDDSHSHTAATLPAGTDDQIAAEVPFTPAGTIAATDTQAAVEEVATDAASALSTHAGAADPHPGYLTPAEGDAAYDALGAAAARAPATADYLVGTAQAGLSAEIVVGTSPGGELGGTWGSPTIDTTHSGSSHAGVISTHEAAGNPHPTYLTQAEGDALYDPLGSSSPLEALDEGVSLTATTTSFDFVGAGVTATAAGDAVTVTIPGGSSDDQIAAEVPFTPAGTIAATDTQAAVEEVATDAAAALSTHAGAADPHAAYLKEADFDDIDFLVGTATGHTAAEIVVGTTPGGELGGTWASPTVDATHAGSAHHDAVTVGAGLDVTGQLVELDLSEIAAGGELGGFLDAPTVDASHSGSTHAATQAAAEATAAAALTGHTGDTSDAHDASAVSVVPFATIAATDVQAALEEIVAEASIGHAEDHDHDGAPTQKLAQANTHETPDTDVGPTSLHHTLGTGANQSAAGNHGHTLDFGEAGDISAEAFGDTAAAGATGEIADAGHRHAMPANPVTAHEAAGDPHPTYLTAAEGDAAYPSQAEFDDHSARHEDGGADEISIAGLAGIPAELTTHAGAADPHTGYVREADANWIDLTDSGATTLHSHAGGGYTDEEAQDAVGTILVDSTSVDFTYADATPSITATVITGTTAAAIGTSAGGSAATPSKSDHVHATGAGTPSTQAFGDSAAVGTGPAAAMTDHKHAMPADPVTAHAAAGDPHTGYRLESADHSHATTGLQGGTIDHGALTGLGDDDHPQYLTPAEADAVYIPQGGPLTEDLLAGGFLFKSADTATSFGAQMGLDDADGSGGGNAQFKGGDGGPGEAGGFFQIAGGDGDDGNDAGARFRTEGGNGVGNPGRAQIKTNASTGASGDVLTAQGDGTALWVAAAGAAPSWISLHRWGLA